MTLKFTDLSKRLHEAKNDTVVFAFGRFNPPTVGHTKLFIAVEKEGKKAKDHFVFGSHSFDTKKNPLNPKLKQKVLAKAFPRNNVKISSKQTPTALHIASMLFAKGSYKELVMVAGSDRVQEFQTLLDKYNGKEGRHGLYNFDTIKVVSSGERDADASDASGASGTKMREYAAKNDYENFAKYSPQSLSDKDVKTIFNAVRKVLPKLDREEFEPINQVREDYLLGNVFAIGDQVFDLNEKKQYKIIEHGPNFVYCEGEDGNVYTKWLSDIGNLGEVKQDGDIEGKSGSQPAKYYKGLAKSTKSKRDAHFKKGADKSDDDASAYKPAPGDADAKTKPSKHTNKFKKMFGEVRKDEQKNKTSTKSVSIEDFNHYPGQVDAPKSKNPDDWVAGDPDADYTIKGFDGKNSKSVIDKANKQVEKERGLTLKNFIDRDEILERERLKKNSTLQRDKKLKNLLLPKKGKAGTTKFSRTDTMRKTLAAELEEEGSTKVWQRLYGELIEEPVEIDEFLEENYIVELETPINNNDGVDDDFEASLEKKIDAYDTLEDVADLYPDLDNDGDHDDDDTKLQITKDAEEMGQIEDNYKWVSEVLTPAQRFKRSQQMKRLGKKIARARMIALKRPSSPDKLNQKAQRHARNLMRKKFTKDQNYADLSFQQKAQIEKKLQGKSAVINRIAMKVKPKLKKLEQQRLINMNKAKPTNESALIETNQYRIGSEMYYETFNDWKKSVDRSELEYFDKELLESDIGSHALYEGNHVPLDCPMIEEEEQPELNKPKAGGTKKYYVYVKDGDKVKKVSWGDTTGLKIKLNDPVARKSFAARHKCDTKKDKTKPGYWACRMPYFAKQLGLSGGGNYFW